MSATILNESAPAVNATPSLRSRWAGRILSGIAVLFLAWDTAIKLLGVKEAVEGTAQLGFPPQHLFTIGLLELACLATYLVPRTAPIGAILLTGYFGGAICTHFRLGNPLLSHVLFPIYVATLLWGGLYLSDPRI